MSRRKLSKKDFERMLNEKGEALRLLSYKHTELDLMGMDDYFESWKARRSDAVAQTGGEGVVFPGYGTWLRKNDKKQIPNSEFDVRYDNWVHSYA